MYGRGIHVFVVGMSVGVHVYYVLVYVYGCDGVCTYMY